MAPRRPNSALLFSKAPRKLVVLFTLTLSVTYLFYTLLTCYSSLQFPVQETGVFVRSGLLGSTQTSLQDPRRPRGTPRERLIPADNTQVSSFESTYRLKTLQGSSVDHFSSLENSNENRFSTTDSSRVAQIGFSQDTITEEQSRTVDSSVRTPLLRFSTVDSAQGHPGDRERARAQSHFGDSDRLQPSSKDSFALSTSHRTLPGRWSNDIGSAPSEAPRWGHAPIATTTKLSAKTERLARERQKFSTTEGKIEPRAPRTNSTTEYGEQKLPQAIIIGVKKGGTRALLEALRVHPDVRAVRVEPHFFDRNYDKGLEWYRNLMPNTLDGQTTMEKTPSYFVTNEAPQRIHKMAKDIKLIIVVRNPITRAISDYTQTLSKRPEIPSFEVLAFKNRTLGLINASWSALRLGIYAWHLESWLRYFRLSQNLFIHGERLIIDPAGELDKVQDFLGLKRIVTDKHFYFNKTKGFLCLKKLEDSSAPRCLGKSKGRTHPTIEPEVIHRLHKF